MRVCRAFGRRWVRRAAHESAGVTEPVAMGCLGCRASCARFRFYSTGASEDRRRVAVAIRDSWHRGERSGPAVVNEKVENLVLEQLRQMRSKVDQVYDAVQTLNVKMHAFRHHLRGNKYDIDAHRDSIGKLQSRIDRTERRLELVDEKN